MHTIRLCNCWFACLFITLIYCIDGILYVFRTHASCWVCNPKHLMQLLSYWTCIVVFIPSLSGYQHSETQEVRVNCHDTIDTKSCNPHALAQEHRSLDSDSSRFCFQDPCHKHKISVALATQNS